MISNTSFLAHADEFVIQFIFWTGVAVPTITSWFWPWWQTSLGWTVTTEAICLATVTFPSDLQLEFGTNTQTMFWQWWVAISFFAAGLNMLWRIAVIWRVQRIKKASKGENGGARNNG